MLKYDCFFSEEQNTFAFSAIKRNIGADVEQPKKGFPQGSHVPDIPWLQWFHVPRFCGKQMFELRMDTVWAKGGSSVNKERIKGGEWIKFG